MENPELVRGALLYTYGHDRAAAAAITQTHERAKTPGGSRTRPKTERGRVGEDERAIASEAERDRVRNETEIDRARKAADAERDRARVAAERQAKLNALVAQLVAQKATAERTQREKDIIRGTR